MLLICLWLLMFVKIEFKTTVKHLIFSMHQILEIFMIGLIS